MGLLRCKCIFKINHVQGITTFKFTFSTCIIHSMLFLLLKLILWIKYDWATINVQVIQELQVRWYDYPDLPQHFYR